MKGTVKVPHDYFLKMARADYRDYRSALPREFYQNSIDANATDIFVVVDKETRSIQITDNGCGMSRDVLLNKLLVLGGTHKAQGSVGAFGKAKELLFFSWERYEIKTNNLMVQGVGADFELIETQDRHQGTSVILHIQEEVSMNAIEAYFRDIACKMETGAHIYVNNFPVARPKPKGMLQRDEEWIKIYQNKSIQRSHAWVRIDGIWMFSIHVGPSFGALTFELNRSSLEAMTSNRDSFQWKYQDLLEPLIADLQINKASALKKKPETVLEKIEGTGSIKVSEQVMRSALVDDDGNLTKDLGAITSALLDAGCEVDDVTAQRLYAEVEVQNTSIEVLLSRLSFIGYKPDFYIKHMGESRIQRYIATTKAKVLATMWTEVIKQVLLDNNLLIDFTAGFTFDGTVEAEHIQQDEEHLFLLNPSNLCKVFKLQSSPLSNRRLLVRDMKARACHEIAHLRLENHDEAFMLAVCDIEARTWLSDLHYAKIQKVR